METINGLIEFLYVAENSSFSAAAKNLKVSKSHISKQISRLEDRLEVRLFNRTTRKISLTKVGEELYHSTKHIFSELAEVEARLSQSKIEPSGTIRLSVAGAFAEKHVASALINFSKLYPKISIDMVFSGEIVNLIDEKYDLAIRYGKLESSSLIAKKLIAREEIVCASPEYLKKYGIPKLPKELKNFNCLMGTNPQWSFRINGKVQKMNLSGNWHSNNGSALTLAALSGLGIVRLPASYVHDSIKNKKLVRILSKYELPDLGVWAVYPNKKHLPTRVRLLIDHLSEYFNAIDVIA